MSSRRVVEVNDIIVLCCSFYPVSGAGNFDLVLPIRELSQIFVSFQFLVHYIYTRNIRSKG